MTLFKQIALLMSSLLLLLLGTVLVLNFSNTNASVQEQLYEDAKNTATSLSLSLGSAGGDESIMSTMINANFDSGHYRRIALYDMDEQLVYERKIEARNIEVPEWFTNLVHIDIPVATAQVSSGWSPVGILSVQSDSAYAYVLLYNSLIGLLSLFGSLFVLGLILLHLILRLVLKPLEKVRRQAEAILGNEFIIQEEIPYTTEFRDVVNGMNAMITKVKDIFDKGNRAMQQNRELLYNDRVSGLYNRRYLMMRLPEFLDEESSYDYGVLVIMALHGAQEANQNLGHQRTDEMFAALGEIVKGYGEAHKNYIAARLNGTEFALVLPGCDDKSGCSLGEGLCNASGKLLQEFGLEGEEYGLNAGVYRFRRGQGIGDILSKADYALSQANLLPHGHIYHYVTHDVDSIMGKEAWRKIIRDALEQRRFALMFRPVVDSRDRSLHHRVTTFSLSDGAGNDYTYGTFIAPVISLGLESELYLRVIEALLQSETAPNSIEKCAVRLPMDFLHTPNLTDALTQLFEQHQKHPTCQIVFELPDALIGENLDLVTHFAHLFKAHGFGFGINQFTGASGDYSFLQELKPAYIKANAAFLMDQSLQGMSTLHILTKTIGIELIAESVMDEKQLERLRENDIDIIQGPQAELLL